MRIYAKWLLLKEMVSAKYVWGNVLLDRKLQTYAKYSNFEHFESALYVKSVSMPLIYLDMSKLHIFWLTQSILTVYILGHNLVLTIRIANNKY